MVAEGQWAYALVHTTSRGAAYEHTAHSLDVYFSGAAQCGSVGPGAHVALLQAGIQVDDCVRSAYWQAIARLALRW